MPDDVSCFRQNPDRLLGPFTFHHDVVRVEGGDCEDADSSLCQWTGDGSQDARQREIQVAVHFQNSPAGFLIINPTGHCAIQANDGEFLWCARDIVERSRTPSPVWNRSVRGKLADRQNFPL